MPSAALACALIVLAGGAACAQTPSLVSIRALQTPGAAELVLVFGSNVIPPFKIYGDGTSNVSVLLIGTGKGANTPANIGPIGPITGGSVAPIGDSLSIQLSLQNPAKVRVVQGGTSSLIIQVPQGTPAAAGAGPAPATGLPAANSGLVHEIVHLNYADLSEVAGLLVPGSNVASNDTFEPQPSAGNFGASGIGGGTLPTNASAPGYSPTLTLGLGQNSSLAQHLNDNVAIDRRLNAVVLTGTPDVVATYKDFIKEIDVPLGRVMLETQVVELTDSAANDLGIDYTNAAGAIATATMVSQSLLHAVGSASLQAAVYDEVQHGNGRIIAQPRILALDGTPASIITGDALPIVTSITVSGVNAVQQQVQYVNVGVNLQIQPRISSDGYVTAHIFSAVSSVTGYSQTYPQISQRQASTQATVKDGSSFVIGGLLEKTELYSFSKIPGIGDLPIIGALFRVRHDSFARTNLYIIVTPHIISYGGQTEMLGPNPTFTVPGGTP